MADVIKDSFVETNNHAEVLFQRGRVVADFELNEAQRIMRVNFQRLLEDAVQKVAAGEDFSPGSNDDGFRPTPGGADQVAFGAGSIVFAGIRYRYTGSTQSLPAWAGPGDTTYCVYARIQETEVADPASLAKIGETTRRRKISVTLQVSTTGLPGVPASSSLDLWQGGTKYEPLALVVRRAGDSSVLTTDITDMRRLLPSSVVAAISRQEGFEVKAVSSRQFESPWPSANYVVGAGIIPANDWVWAHTFWKYSTAAFGPDGYAPQRLARIKAYGETFPEALAGVGYLEVEGNGDRGGGVVGTNLRALRLVDANSKASENEKLIPVTQTGHGHVKLFDLEPVPVVTHTSGGPRSIVGTLNAKWSATVGDGIRSFGDFSGPGAIRDAVIYFMATKGTGICHLQVKQGAYASSPLTLGDSVSLVIEGISAPINGEEVVPGSLEDRDGVQWGIDCSDDVGILVPAGSVLDCTGIGLLKGGSSSAYPLVRASGTVQFRKCEVNGCVQVEALEPGEVATRTCGLRGFDTKFDAGPGDVSTIRIGTSTGYLGTDGRFAIRHVFEDCYFGSPADGTTVLVRSTAAVSNSAGSIAFERCVFEPPWGSTGGGILGAVTADAYAGYMTVEQVSFVDCKSARVSDRLDAPVFQLRAGNGSGTEIGVIFKQITMRGCDWRVLENPARATIPWYLGESTGIQNLNKQVTGAWSIENLVIEDTFFGYVPNGVDPGGSNANGNEVTLSGYVEDYSAALTVCCENLVMRNVKFEGSNVRSTSAEILFAGTRTTSVDGLEVLITQSGDAEALIPKTRVMMFPSFNNAPISRLHGLHTVKGFRLETPRSAGSTAEIAIVYLVPGSCTTFDDFMIIAGDEDYAFRVNARNLPYINTNYVAYDYGGLTLKSGTIDFSGTGLRYDLPISGTIDYVQDIVLDKVKFVDCQYYYFDVYEEPPAGNTNYHTLVLGFKAYGCWAQSYSMDELVPHARCRFNVGRATGNEQIHARNLTLIGNDFGHSCSVEIGANDALTPGGMRCMVMSNVFNVTLKGTYPDPAVSSRGFETGYSAVGSDMVPNRQFDSGVRMLYNDGELFYVP